ncbi:uncharacterized protein LOC143076841 [Mytilus galloprovincialis]|uniref:Coiled-coil domain-containing protein 92 n=1 Tax=Mytilus galloprovincialis TaxID=29158 RepID=A0A8B6D603_MYTGA|nr:coiled-coil domain-containing protein 92 [Mytilus galloprovincialis]VDI15609.1 coiled-coil domain-containing protein 92 [Mytilus galloprovincialis]VDI15610.1 coiled-coil domain-containing protein 92 [Mytilus galloprovincialis]
MTSEAAIHKRNLDSAILFMQQEHAETLKGLHKEIENLQKKCSELTFQLNMQGIGADFLDPGSNSKLTQVEDNLKIQTQKSKQLESEIEKKDKHIKDYEISYKKQKMKFLDENRKTSQEMDRLKAENESKANQVAYLTSELHKLKKLQLEHSTERKAFVAEAHKSGTKAYVAEARILPIPPKEPVTLKIRRGNIRHVKPQTNKEDLERHPLRVSSGSSSTRSESPTIEKAKQFLRPEREPSIEVKERHPLPPIRSAPGEERSHSKHVYFQKMTPEAHQTRAKTHKVKRKEQEVKLLAVDKVSDQWASRAQESHSSEYN